MKRVGIIGAGTMGGAHAHAWSGTAAELVGFYDIDAEAAGRAARAAGISTFPSRQALFDAVDIVDVCVPTYAHKDNVIAAAGAGKHVVCEKPMALSLEDCGEMIRAAEGNNVRLFIAQVVRFFPEYATAKRLIDDGTIGKLGVVRLRRGGSNPGEGAKKWFAQEYLSGGVILDLMVHDIDYARWIGGDVERVYCKRFLGTGGDYALVTLRYKSGAMAHLEGCWAYPTGMFRTGFDLAGDDGLLRFDSEVAAPLRLRMKDEAAASAGVVVPSSPLDPSDHPYYREIEHFLSCLLSGEEFLVTPRDAMAAVQIALAARQSALSGLPVTLEPLSI
ncbi:MAG: Gfo/Idh/MocA family protein [Anaerolineae bacterium]